MLAARHTVQYTHTHTVIHANMGSLFWIVVGLLGLGLRLVHST